MHVVLFLLIVLLTLSNVLAQMPEGDMMMTEEMFRLIYGQDAFDKYKHRLKFTDGGDGGRKLSLLNLTEYFWTERNNDGKVLVPWTFKSGDFTTLQRQEIESFLVVMEEKLGVVHFVERTTETDYVEFVNDNEYCASFIGRQGGKQEVLLQDGCVYRGIVEHEMLHVLGVFHEHTRYDRDDYVTILFSNIDDGYELNFLKRGADHTTSLGVEYDYDSVMHYGPYDFSIEYGVRKTIESYGNVIGQRDGMSSRDIEQIRLMYKCADGPREKQSFCSMNCLCLDGEGTCTDNSQCDSQLSCNDGVCGTRAPSRSPITFSPTTPRPTKSPTAKLTTPPKGNWWVDGEGKLRIVNIVGMALLFVAVLIGLVWLYVRNTSSVQSTSRVDPVPYSYNYL